MISNSESFSMFFHWKLIINTAWCSNYMFFISIILIEEYTYLKKIDMLRSRRCGYIPGNIIHILEEWIPFDSHTQSEVNPIERFFSRVNKRTRSHLFSFEKSENPRRCFVLSFCSLIILFNKFLSLEKFK